MGAAGAHVGVAVAVAVAVGVAVAVAVGVAVAVAVAVGLVTGVLVGVAVAVAVGVAVGVEVAVAVGVAVGVEIGVAVGVDVAVAVGVAVAVAVGVGVGVELSVTVKINSPLVTAREAVVLAARPLPFTVNVPGGPMTLAEPLFAISVYVPAGSADVVVTVTGVPFKSNVPALAPVMVRGAVVPPPYAVKPRPPADRIRPLPDTVAIVAVTFEPVALPFKACPGPSASAVVRVEISKIEPLFRMMFGELAIEPPTLNFRVPPMTVVSPV